DCLDFAPGSGVSSFSAAAAADGTASFAIAVPARAPTGMFSAQAVTGAPNTSNVIPVGVGPCGTDAYEPNDTTATAYPLPASIAYAATCSADDDWFTY